MKAQRLVGSAFAVIGLLASQQVCAVEPNGGFYLINGTVSSVSGSKCPYAKNLAVTGYSFFPGMSHIQGQPNTHWYNAITPQGQKITAYAILSDDSTFPSFSGNVSSYNGSSSTNQQKSAGTYTLAMSSSTFTSFSADLTVEIPDACTIGYSLNYKQGIPSKFLTFFAVP